MTIRFFISLISTLCCLSLSGQIEISIDDLVAKVYDQNRQPSSDTYKLPWIEEVNVRSETSDWRLREQRYTLRLSPVSLGERRASSKLYNSWQQELVYLKLDKVYDQVADIHKEWVDQDFLSRQILLDSEIVALLSDVEKVTAKQSLLETDKLSILLSVRSRIARLNNSISLDEKRKRDKLKALSEKVEGNYIVKADSIDLFNYIQSATEILLASDRPYVSASDLLELEILQNEMELEKAESNRVLDFVGLQYRGPHDDDLEERVSLGMSFNLPFFTANKLSIAKIKVEQEKEQYQIEAQEQESLAKLSEIKEAIRADLFEYSSYKKLYVDIERENWQLISNMSKQAIINPIVKLNYSIQVLENKQSLLAIQESIVKKYLDYLKATDKYVLGIGGLSTNR